MNKLRVAFAGTPPFAVSPLKTILQSVHEVPLVFTQPDRPSGRGQKLTPSPVKECALENNIPVFQPDRLGDNDAMLMRRENIDVMIVAAFGQIVPRAILEAPRLGCVNIHASILPRWRGASPIVQSILSGDKDSGVSLMKMDEGLDTGSVFMTKKVPIGQMTQGMLENAISQAGSDCLKEALTDLEAWLSKAQPQPEDGITYAPKVKKAQAQVNWSQSGDVVCCHVRAYNPAPMAFTFLDDLRCRIIAVQHFSEDILTSPKQAGSVLDVTSAGILVACGQGGVLIEQIQLPGKAVLCVGEHLRLCRDLFLGKRFASKAC
ncbi:MAG: methionyl-tRNA formyltransferase [Pseudomonadota bacterium]|nr:methionyl-tRNA formyltransferase [Pseudomonadota bacterium]